MHCSCKVPAACLFLGKTNDDMMICTCGGWTCLGKPYVVSMKSRSMRRPRSAGCWPMRGCQRMSPVCRITCAALQLVQQELPRPASQEKAGPVSRQHQKHSHLRRDLHTAVAEVEEEHDRPRALQRWAALVQYSLENILCSQQKNCKANLQGDLRNETRTKGLACLCCKVGQLLKALRRQAAGVGDAHGWRRSA